MTGSCSLKSYDYNYDGTRLFESVSKRRYSFFLDSSMDAYGLGRYSFIGFDPYMVIRKKNEKPFRELHYWLQRSAFSEKRLPTPLPAGAVGFLSYDLGFLMERIGSKSHDDLQLPDCVFGFYDVIITIDHWKRKLHITSSGLPEKNGQAVKKRAQQRLKEVMKIIEDSKECRQQQGDAWTPENTAGMTYDMIAGMRGNFTKQEYRKAIAKALHHIAAGDIYQVNLSQRFCAQLPTFRECDFEIFKLLRRVSPSCFSAFFNCGDFKIISSSPERFLHVHDRLVQTRPMKGTRPRHNALTEDRKQKDALLKSKKDRAELLMIVDLLRNDLGRVCEYGSVQVREMRTLEKYSTVFQTTSTVKGILHKDKDHVDLLKACFPGGSITGCPKIRSMQIIDELEPTRRGPYTGSLGYISFTGDMDLNILIRTLVIKGDKAYFQVGGGIVADSKPDDEYNETLVKARGLLSCLAATPSERIAVRA
ncbi:aminodeoxychorismate synthase component I [Candidatus Omnitrophota bacterium]